MEPITLLLFIFAVAFFCEYIDSTLGMGYGTTLTPLLLFIGFEPLTIIPAILFSELLTGSFAAVMHHRAGNVAFDFSHDTEHKIARRLGKLGYVPKSQDSKIALVLIICSLIGAVISVAVAVNLPKLYMKLFIGAIVLTMGIIMLAKRKASPTFSWSKIAGLGAVAAFNKGLSGGGYGPLVTSGQILSGVRTKSSVGITSLSESFTCLVGVGMYLVLGTQVDWSIAPFLVAGAMTSVPICAYTVKRIQLDKFISLVGIATATLGALTLINTLM